MCIFVQFTLKRNERIVPSNVRNTDAVYACVSYNWGDHAMIKKHRFDKKYQRDRRMSTKSHQKKKHWNPDLNFCVEVCSSSAM